MQRINTPLKKLLFSLVLTFGLFAGFNTLNSPKVGAVGCWPGTTAAYFNAQVQVQVLNPDGSFRKWSSDFSVRVVSADPRPINGANPVPDAGVNFPGRPGFPTNDATFRAQAGDGVTESCPTWRGDSSTSLIFGDSTDGKPFLACHWGTWGNGPGTHRGLAFFFVPGQVYDAGGPGYWVPGADGYVEAGGRTDANNQSAMVTFAYRLTSITNEPEGWLDIADCNVIQGWARDLDAPGGTIDVHLYFDGPPGVGQGLSLNEVGATGVYRPDLAANVGFRLPANSPHIPIDLHNGTHTVRAYGINAGAGSNRELSGSPRNIGPCPAAASTTQGRTETKLLGSDGEVDEESPSRVVFGAWTTQVSPNYAVSVTRRFYIKRAANPTVNAYFRTDPAVSVTGSHVFPEITIADPLGSPHRLTVGDQICSSVVVNSPRVTIGFRGAIVASDPAVETGESCKRLVNRPFISFYGGDVSAGGDFAGGTCSGVANIVTHNKNGLGSGVEFAAQATGVIQGFKTSKRNPTAAQALAFANTGAASGGLGEFGNNGCIKDYFTDIDAGYVTPEPSGATTVNFNRSGNFYYKPTSGVMTMGGAIGNTYRAGIYIDGDLIINNGITAGTAWSSISQMSALHVFVRGNIYIQSNVSELTGLFVAQPKIAVPSPATTGRIVTCATGVQPVVPENLFELCGGRTGTRLVVRGALVANHIDYLRTANSLRNATTTTQEANPATSQSAEVINLVPELLMVAPERIKSDKKKDYQFFTSMPPVL